MPNQDPTQNQQDNPTITPVGTPDPTQVTPQGSIPIQNDLPPLPDYMTQTDTNNVQENTSAPVVENVPTEQQPSDDLSGSAAPPDLPPMVSTPKKKFGGKRIIATILGIFLLVGGVGAGIVLTQQQQLFQQKAAGTDYPNLEEECGGTNGNRCGPCEECVYDGSSTRCKYNSNLCPAPPPPTEPPEETNPPNPPSGPTPTPGPVVSCQNVKAFKGDADVPLTTAELSTLKAGDVVTFCAFTDSAIAKTVTFTINGTAQSPITPAVGCVSTKGTCFCSNSYTIPSGVATFNASALLSD